MLIIKIFNRVALSRNNTGLCKGKKKKAIVFVSVIGIKKKKKKTALSFRKALTSTRNNGTLDNQITQNNLAGYLNNRLFCIVLENNKVCVRIILQEPQRPRSLVHQPLLCITPLSAPLSQSSYFMPHLFIRLSFYS